MRVEGENVDNGMENTVEIEEMDVSLDKGSEKQIPGRSSNGKGKLFVKGEC